MSETLNGFPQLDRLLNSYMHEDWDIFGDTPDAAIAAFVKHAGPEDVKALRVEIEQLLGAAGDRIEAEYGQRYPNSLLPSGLGMTARQWLLHIADEVARPSSQPRAAS